MDISRKTRNVIAWAVCSRRRGSAFYKTDRPKMRFGVAAWKCKFIISAAILLGIFVKDAGAVSDIQYAGDIFKFFLPAAAYASTWVFDDDEGRMQFYKSFGTNWAITYALKQTVDKERPNGGGHAFPSWHTSASFQGAAFIQRRYGWKWGVPCYGIASYVGWSRIFSDKHDLADVLAGAAIGTASSYLFTRPFKGVSVSPIVVHDGGGLNFSFHW